MALFSMRVQVISRKAGRSAVGSAAYRAGASLKDAHGNRFDYTAKGAIERTEIMAPEGAPAWVYDREILWQKAEAAEKRKDAQLAREIRIMLPREFTADQRIEVMRDFVQREFVGRGMVADVAWHNPKASDGQTNPHCHIMLTMRPLAGDGFGKKSVGTRKTQQRTTDWNSQQLYEGIRKAWEDTANAVLADNGSAARVDRRSYIERGISELPQPYLGVAARVKQYSARMHERVNQWVAQRATAKAWAMGQRVIDRQLGRLEGKVNRVAEAADLVGRFFAWMDTKIDRLAQGPPNLAPAAPGAGMAAPGAAQRSGPEPDRGIDL